MSARVANFIHVETIKGGTGAIAPACHIDSIFDLSLGSCIVKVSEAQLIRAVFWGMDGHVLANISSVVNSHAIPFRIATRASKAPIGRPDEFRVI